MTKQASITNSSAVLELKNIPTELILYACQQWTYCGKHITTGTGKNTNNFLKDIAVWIILKNETTTGIIKNYRSQLVSLADKCQLSPSGLDKRLRRLRQEELVQVNGKHLVMSAYKVLGKYDINIKQREETIYYDTSNKARDLPSMLVAIAMGHWQNYWRETYWKKMNQNPDILAEARNHLIAHEADQSRLNDPEYFREFHLYLLLKTYQEERPGQWSFNFLHKDIKANPDVNCKAATYGQRMGYAVIEKINPVTHKDESESMGFSHLKRRLMRKGLITVKKAQVESEYQARKDEKTYHHRYVRASKKTIWYRPDQITINYAVFHAAKNVA